MYQVACCHIYHLLNCNICNKKHKKYERNIPKKHKIIFKCVKIMPEMYNAISRSHPECCHINHFQNVTFITNIKKNYARNVLCWQFWQPECCHRQHHCLSVAKQQTSFLTFRKSKQTLHQLKSQKSKIDRSLGILLLQMLASGRFSKVTFEKRSLGSIKQTFFMYRFETFFQKMFQIYT